VLVTLGGTVVIAGGAGRRELAAEQFFAGALSTALEPGEMVVELRYPRPPAGAGAAFVEFARRRGDFAIAGVAAMLTVRDGRCEQARLTIVGMGEGPFRARAAEAALTACRIDAEACRALPQQPTKSSPQSSRPTMCTRLHPTGGIWRAY
jgi:carbon-monoxide dehydrogenase medium subunit